ncbi:MAG: glycosyl hydrolase family 28 protein [Acetobacter sp.]|nr:glycosyl hydrolase family 28 protein [Bacteroides sp.]MCM1340984.1 glycosyl hydrolase family 28 protein [Acetobacter sp.]MCM1432460.1 glycosyl hydrolase family 28 protein [Clostridiales bacterium]
MAKIKRTPIDKLNTLFFGKDLRVTEGEPYTEVREYDFSSYYPENDYIHYQSVPESNVFDIRDFGASVDNEDNSQYINKAVEIASQFGGTVVVSGGDYICKTVELKSDVTLFIERDSAICANTTGKGYEKRKALIYAEKCKNITFTGGGKLKGNGNLFGRKPLADCNNTVPAKYIDVIEMRKDYRSQLRFAHPSKYGGPVELKNCKDITVENFIIENSAYWTFKLVNCDNVSFSNFVINNNRNVANADGIDIAGSSNVFINHCFISTADDGVVIKNALWLGNEGEMNNICITDCEIISRTNAIKVGTETTYDINDINITDCRLFMTDLYPGSVSGISLEACDGTVLSNINISNIKMNRCTCPVFIRLGNRNRASEVSAESANAIEFGAKINKRSNIGKKMFDGRSRVRDIRISDVTADNVEIPVIIAGYRQGSAVNRVQNVELNNITLNYADIPEIIDKRIFIPEYADVYPEGWRFRNLPSYSLWIRHAENINIENFVCNHPQPTWKKEIIKDDVI